MPPRDAERQNGKRANTDKIAASLICVCGVCFRAICYKTFFILNSAEHENDTAHKC